MNLKRKKSIADLMAQASGKALPRTLGAFDLFMMGIGVIIGTGIFVMTGVAAATYAGPAIILSFAFSAVACAFICLAYSELAAALPAAVTMTMPILLSALRRWAKVRPDAPGRLWSTSTRCTVSRASTPAAASADGAVSGVQPSASTRSEISSAISGSSSTIRIRILSFSMQVLPAPS